MKTLTFTAPNHANEQHDSQAVQTQVVQVLVKKLEQYGFQTLSQSGDHVAVSVDEHELPLAITCQSQETDHQVVCAITSYPDEDQDWLERITEQSLLNQLAQAVENSLKQENFANFEWKEH